MCKPLVPTSIIVTPLLIPYSLKVLSFSKIRPFNTKSRQKGDHQEVKSRFTSETWVLIFQRNGTFKDEFLKRREDISER